MSLRRDYDQAEVTRSFCFIGVQNGPEKAFQEGIRSES